MEQINLSNSHNPDWALFLPAVSSFFIAGLGKQREGEQYFDQARIPEAFNGDVECLNFLNSKQGLYTYKWGLYSAGHANLDITNLNDVLMYYFLNYGVSVMYFRTLSQYLDYNVNQCIREYWKNGWFNDLSLKPPEPSWWDSYYYYTDNMDKVEVPFICYLADSEGELLDLVDSEHVIEDFVNGKTYNVNDEVHTIESAHIDIGMGLRNPVYMFPQLGDWLARI